MNNIRSTLAAVWRIAAPYFYSEDKWAGRGLLAAVIAIELATKLCAQSLFDPMPSYGHVAAVAFVPACNLLIWTALDREQRWSIGWLAFANGAAIAIAIQPGRSSN